MNQIIYNKLLEIQTEKIIKYYINSNYYDKLEKAKIDWSFLKYIKNLPEKFILKFATKIGTLLINNVTKYSEELINWALTSEKIKIDFDVVGSSNRVKIDHLSENTVLKLLRINQDIVLSNYAFSFKIYKNIILNFSSRNIFKFCGIGMVGNEPNLTKFTQGDIENIIIIYGKIKNNEDDYAKNFKNLLNYVIRFFVLKNEVKYYLLTNLPETNSNNDKDKIIIEIIRHQYLTEDLFNLIYEMGNQYRIELLKYHTKYF